MAAATSCKVTSIEVDPVHVAIARHIVAFAGVGSRVEVKCCHSNNLLEELALSSNMFSMVFLDSRSSGYETEIATLEQAGFLDRGTVIVADNVLKPGAPRFLWEMTRSDRFSTKIVSLQEFAMASEDWMSVSVLKKLRCQVDYGTMFLAGEEAPPAIQQLQEACERMRHRTTNLDSGVDFIEWAAFSQTMRAELSELGIVP
eukprot:3903771-Amphidinium_carterae.1